MKKVIVTLLIILPFLLIYFISFTGQVLSRYTHIDVERIAVLNDKGDEYAENSTIKIGINEQTTLKVKVYPELASDKSVTISKTDKYDEICFFDEQTNEIKGINYGKTTFLISSNDRHFVQFVIYVEVAQDKLEDFKLSKTEVEIPIGKSEAVEAEIIPQTTLPMYRKLVWESEDSTIAKVTQLGVITGLRAGKTRIKVSSVPVDQGDLPIVHYIDVTISSNLGTGVWFDLGENNKKVYTITENQIDLKTITIINGLDGLTFDDIYYTLDSSSDSVDKQQIATGIVKFSKADVVKISVHATWNGKEYSDQITLRYKT